MKDLIFVANWKSNFTTTKAKEWLDAFESGIKNYELGTKTIVLCPPFTLLQHSAWFSGQLHLSIALGAQDISPFPEGAYTGEIAASQIKEFCQYVIIGHSERRENFGETDEMLEKKVKEAKVNELQVVFCVQGKETKIPEKVEIVAYEPVEAIGTGNPDTPQHAQEVATHIKQHASYVKKVLYGGSVNTDNIDSFSKLSGIDGVLVGGASLSANDFADIIKKA